MNFWADTPYTTAYVRNEFLHDQQKGHGEFTLCTVFGFRAEPMRVPMFQIMLENGAQWARIPIHALCSKPCPELALPLTVWWDSFSRTCEIKEVAFLRNHRVKAIGRDGVQRAGVYLMTAFWADGGWSEAAGYFDAVFGGGDGFIVGRGSDWGDVWDIGIGGVNDGDQCAFFGA